MIVEIPGVGNVEFPDGMAPEAIQQALAQYATPKAPAAPNADGTYGQPPEGVTLNPATGQMEDMRSPANPNIDTGTGTALAQGLGQGVSFGTMDEVVGGMYGATGPGSFDQNYDYARAKMNEELRRGREDQPVAAYGGEIGGAIGSSLAATGPYVAQAGTTMAGAGRGALAGLFEGTLYGGASADEGERGRGAVVGAGIGATAGLAAPLAVAGVRSAWRSGVSNPAANLFNVASPERSGQAIQTALRRSGQSADDVQRALTQAGAEGQPQFVLADALGNPGQRMLSGIARTPGDGRNEIAQFLTQRQDGQGGRLAGFIADGLGAPDTAAARTASLTAARGQAADTAYGAARQGAGPVDVRGALAAIDDRIGGMQGSGVVGDGIDAKLAGYRARLAAKPSSLKPGETARELSDFDRVLGLKQAVQDDIGAAVRAGRNNEARELGKIMSTLDGALEDASGGYRAANDGFREASRVIDQVDAGKAATSNRMRPQDTTAAYGRLTADQQAAFRAGYADPTIARIDSAAPGVNKARPLRSDKAQAELGAMAKDTPLLQRQIGRENTMFETGNAALGGSKTADNMADAAETSGMDLGVLANLVTGRWGAAGAQLGQKLANAATGQSPATRELLAKALMSRDVQAALAPAIRKQIADQGVNRTVETMLRSGGIRLSN